LTIANACQATTTTTTRPVKFAFAGILKVETTTNFISQRRHNIIISWKYQANILISFKLDLNLLANCIIFPQTTTPTHLSKAIVMNSASPNFDTAI